MSTLSNHYSALCADGRRNRLAGKTIKSSRSIVATLNKLETEVGEAVTKEQDRMRAEGMNEQPSEAQSSQCTAALLSAPSVTTAFFGHCLPEQLPIIGSSCRAGIVRAAAEARLPTVSYSTDYCLDFSQGYIGTAACVVLCEALLTYPVPDVPAADTAAAEGDAANGIVARTTSSATEATNANGENTAVSLATLAPPKPIPVVYCALKELRLPSCGLDTNAAYALFRLLTNDRCAYTLKVLDIRHNPFLGLEAGQLFLGAMGYIIRDGSAADGEDNLLALLQVLNGSGDEESAVGIPNLIQDGEGMESHTRASGKLTTFDMGTQTGPGLSGAASEAGDDEMGGSLNDPSKNPLFRSRPKAPQRHISRLCVLHSEGTNIPPHYVRRLGVLCEQNRHL